MAVLTLGLPSILVEYDECKAGNELLLGFVFGYGSICHRSCYLMMIKPSNVSVLWIHISGCSNIVQPPLCCCAVVMSVHDHWKHGDGGGRTIPGLF